MSDYMIGRDVQELRSRIERCEAALPFGTRPSRMSEMGGVVHGEQGGLDLEKKPILWKSDRTIGLPPFMYGFLGLDPYKQFDLQPESKTWHCVPEPLILSLIATGEEHVRFSNQVFSIIKVTDPNSGTTTATAIYSATMTSRNGQSVDYAGGYQGPPYVPAHYVGPSFPIRLRDAGGAGLFDYYHDFSVRCRRSIPVDFRKDFTPGLYGLVAGASWQLPNWDVTPC